MRSLFQIASCSCFSLLIIFSSASAQITPPFVKPPEVISTKDLKAMLDAREIAAKKAQVEGKKPEEPNFVVVDVRSDDEINVSIIPGAITKAQYEKDKDKYRGKMVIPYCLVGGRSATFSNELVKSGVLVKNYKGSIVDWVSNELPLVTLKGEPTNKVFINPERFKVPAKYEAVGK
ncbi:MAG: rhodanese-like domain-containing protein [Pirellulales bacterium]